ncbi:hypothetical protein B0H14DRAFT_2780642 [Mycena olivaceomarginata]|nr:hypothetical protein B0H14DRAFT_2780642 [Mycena olivaceomarginata]
MDSTPLFCGGASSGLGGCGRLTLLNSHWRGPGSGAAASVVFLAGPTRGSVHARLCQCQLEGVGCGRVVRFFCFVFILKEKLYPRLPAATLSVPNTTLHVPQIACEHADQKAEYIFIRGAVSPQLGLLLPESGICIGTGERLFRATSDPRYILFPPLPHIQRSSRRLGRDRLGHDQPGVNAELTMHMTHSVDPGILRAIRGVSLPAVLWFINGNGRGSLAPDLYINI